MRCLMCNREITEGKSISEILLEEDFLCHACRRQWIYKKRKFKFEGYPCRTLLEYNEAFSKALIQYKECYDEALAPVFLYPYKSEVKRYLKGRTLLLLPSSKEKVEARGFSALRGMYECLGLPIKEPFIKLKQGNQKTKGYLQRKEVAHEIGLSEGISLPEKIALVDDVITTGSTMKGALNALRHGNYDIRIFVLADAYHRYHQKQRKNRFPGLMLSQQCAQGTVRYDAHDNRRYDDSNQDGNGALL